MKQRFLTPALCLGLLFGCAPKTYLNVPKNGLNDFFSPREGKFHISAHRGGGDYTGYPENCVESFQYLARQMPVVIECDISMTRDSVLMMMHDDRLDRTTTGTGKVADVTWDYCKTLKLEDNAGNQTKFAIPTLDEVLRWGRNKVVFTLDVKRGVPFERVVGAVRRAGAAPYAAVITYNATDAARVHQLDPSLMISVNVRNRADYDRLRELGVPDSRMIAFIGTREADRDLYRFLHERGIACILGTLGNLDKQTIARGDSLYRQFVANGADVLSTDRPLEAWKALN